MSWDPDKKLKILVLNGSPRGKDSATMAVTNAFLEGLKAEANCEIEIIELSSLKIIPCLGCLSCWGRTEGECIIQNDDIPLMKQKIEDCDIFIESYPLYFFGMPGTMKVFTDRMLSMMCTYRGQKPPTNKESFHGIRNPHNNQRFVVISSCAYSETSQVFDSLSRQYDCICGQDKYEKIFVPQLKTLMELDHLKSRHEKFLSKFVLAGKEFAKAGVLSEETRVNLTKAPFSEATYKVLLANFWNEQKNGKDV